MLVEEILIGVCNGCVQYMSSTLHGFLGFNLWDQCIWQKMLDYRA